MLIVCSEFALWQATRLEARLSMRPAGPGRSGTELRSNRPDLRRESHGPLPYCGPPRYHRHYVPLAGYAVTVPPHKTRPGAGHLLQGPAHRPAFPRVSPARSGLTASVGANFECASTVTGVDVGGPGAMAPMRQ